MTALLYPYLTIGCLSLLLRTLIGLHTYSGFQTPGKYGDFEAQRHWMELTIHLPATDWYRNTTDNDLGYWGLDYPPLSAYQSWLCGKALQMFDPEAVALRSSRGYETEATKAWLRLSVIAFDILVFFPGVLAAAYVFGKGGKNDPKAWTLLIALLQPAALLIDHGHFQYNNISLGLSAGAAAAVASGWHLLGSSLFCLAMNHKHMTLYYAPAFFAHLLGHAWRQKGLPAKVLKIVSLAVVVLATFALCWLPYIGSWQAAQEVLLRLTPVKRGLFEDYVANFWCVTSLALLKWREAFSQQALVRMSFLGTVASCLPSMVQQIWKPSQKGLLYCMTNCAFAFYMFSYQVHEKSVLLILLPVSLLAADEPWLAHWLPTAACFSMFPLLKKDGLQLAYLAVLLIWFNLTPSKPAFTRLKAEVQSVIGSLLARQLRGVFIGSTILAIAIHISDIIFAPPTRLPYLYDAAYVSLAFTHLLAATLYFNMRQWTADSSENSSKQSFKEE